MNRSFPWLALLTGVLVCSGRWVEPALARNPSLPVSQATHSARWSRYQKEIERIRPDAYDLQRHPIRPEQVEHWRQLLWATALLEPSEPYVQSALAQILSLTTRPQLSDDQRWIVHLAMQVATQHYLTDPTTQTLLAEALRQTLANSPQPEWVAMSLSALARGEPDLANRQLGMALVQQRFPHWQTDLSLYTTLRDLAEQIQPTPLPPLADLLAWQVVPGELQLYVFCRPDRTQLCHTLLKDPQGRFVSQTDGQPWSVPLLLRSLHSLRWNFKRGETAQGLYRIEGVVPQPDLDYFYAFGQFDLVRLFLPFEPGVKTFVPKQKGAFRGSLADYQALLPPSWHNYFPIQQSYWAGKLGRDYFRIHGTGDDPALFASNQRYPTSAGWNPTIGCLSAIELYDDQGRLVRADMPIILQTLRTLAGPNFTGYVIVVDLPDGVEVGF